MKDETGCDVCQEVFSLLENYVAQNSTEAFLEWYLENVICNWMNSSVNQTCDAVMEAGVPTVIDWLIESENPLVVCQQLTVCAASQKKPAFNKKMMIA
jgi:hypothetical protein